MFSDEVRRRATRGTLTACLMLLGGAGGCLTQPAGNNGGNQDPSSKPAEDCPARVYLIRGLWDVFSVGLDTLGQELRDAGVDAHVISGADWPDLLAQLVAENESGVTLPIVLIGHSYGADDAIEVARQLNKRDVPVHLLGLIDATDPGRIPANVDRCVHVYLPNPLGSVFPGEFSGNPVELETGNAHTVLENITATTSNFGNGANGIDHFNIESSGAVHSFMLTELVAACESAAEAQ